MTKFYVVLQNFLKDQRGISAVEYAILAGILIVLIAGGVATFGTSIEGLFEGAASAIDTAIAP